MKRLVLVGGGHSHIEVLLRFSRDAPPGEILLVTPEPRQIYSGMLPGHIAGHYRFDDIQIDLATLCARARIPLKLARVTALDFRGRSIACSNGSRIDFDLLSLDAGSTPHTGGIRGVPEHVVSLRPLAQFVSAWNEIRDAVVCSRSRQRIAIIGAGAAGVELALAMHHAVRNSPVPCEFLLMSDTDRILPDHGARARRCIEHILRERGITMPMNQRVTGVDRGILHTEKGSSIAADHVIWATGAAAPAWIMESGLARDEGGFMLVDHSLQSISHAGVFGAGDVASLRDHPRPKAGVYAVRQGPPLATNLRHALLGKRLVAHYPQRTALALISTGNRYAVGEYGSITFHGAWAWRWKDFIDRRFVSRYR